MQEPREPSNTKSFLSAAEIKNRYSQHELTCHQHQDVSTPLSLQESRTCCAPLSLRPEDIAGGSQDCDLKIWDDLPLSESLKKFLEVIESEIAITQTDASNKCRLDNGNEKLHADHSSLSVTPQRTTGPLHTPPIALRSSQARVKPSSGKDNLLSHSEANPTPSVQKELQPCNPAEAVSISTSGKIFLKISCQTLVCSSVSIFKRFRNIIFSYEVYQNSTS